MKTKINQAIRSLTLRIQNMGSHDLKSEEGSAMVIALLIMILLMGFVALAVTRTNSETMSSANDATESRTFDAANASLEVMTRNFDKIFDSKLNPDPTDISRVIANQPPGFPEYSFSGQNVTQTAASQQVVMKGGSFQGLSATQTEWQLDTTVTHIATGVQVALRRKFLNNEIPIFQFGIFYDDDMEFYPGPAFSFGGRVHSNGNMFLRANTKLTFSSKVTAKSNIFTDIRKNGNNNGSSDQVYIKDGTGTPQHLSSTMGSVLTCGSGTTGSPVPNYSATDPIYPQPPVPSECKSTSWPSNGRFDGNLLANQPELALPIKINARINGRHVDLSELVKRGNNVGDMFNKAVYDNANHSPVLAQPTPGPSPAPVIAVDDTTKDDGITAGERYYNKTGIRISLADSQQELPGCAAAVTGTTHCGIRLDSDTNNIDAGWKGISTPGLEQGYQPVTMADGYKATEMNGERFTRFPAGSAGYKPQMWIKIETVQYDAASSTYLTTEITEDILSLGVTEPALSGVIDDPRYSTSADSRSVIKLQRYNMPGASIPKKTTTTGSTFFTTTTTSPSSSSVPGNYVVAGTVPTSVAINPNQDCRTGVALTKIDGGVPGPLPSPVPASSINSGFTSNSTDQAHSRRTSNTGLGAVSGSKYGCIVPYPINMFDTREGLFNETTSVFSRDVMYGTGSSIRVPVNGVMSMIDIDVANMQKFLEGQFDNYMPDCSTTAKCTQFASTHTRALRAKYRDASNNPLTTSDIPSSNGWVVYVSDRRGDWDFDGEYDMENVYYNYTGTTLNSTLGLAKCTGYKGDTFDLAEDFNRDGVVQCDNKYEAADYRAAVYPEQSAFFDHSYYRRGVRLINGADLPGYYDTAVPNRTHGFTVASENGVYVKGNYNATGIASVPASDGSPTPPTDYLPQGLRDVPASVAADGVTILSNNWSDANSFTNPFDQTKRTVTETFTRFAILAGDSIASIDDGVKPNQGGGDPRMNGGVHNFKRFLEDYTNNGAASPAVRLDYCGSLINLFNSHNVAGSFKNGGGAAYNPPTRNWVFDSSFLDINRVPPGTPFFQQIQITGFQRINN